LVPTTFSAPSFPFENAHGYSLDDKFLVHGFSSAWSLQEFTDASDKDAIVGNGLNNGSARGFLLLPQTIQP